MADKKNAKIQTIQGLRGMSAFLIMLSHYSFFKRRSTIFPDGGVEEGQNVLMWIGGAGVSIFILISGFLIYGRYSDNEDAYAIGNIKNRVVLQYKRFLPMHILTMILAVPLLLNVYIDEPVNTAIKVGVNAVILHSWIPHMGIYYSFNSVSWYLNLAIFFVIMTPVMLQIVNGAGSNGNRGIYALTLIIVILQGGIGFAGDIISKHEAVGASHWLTYICPLIRTADFVCGGV